MLNWQTIKYLVLATPVVVFLSLSWEYEHIDKRQDNGDFVRTKHVEVLGWDLPPYSRETVTTTEHIMSKIRAGKLTVPDKMTTFYEVKNGKVDFDSKIDIKEYLERSENN